MMNNLICALSGESPIRDPVCTPTGQICSKRLLLMKLTESNGINPFTGSSSNQSSSSTGDGISTGLTLDESQLIDISTSDTSNSSSNNSNGAGAIIQPPKMPKITSVPSLLTQLQTSYDTLVLELYDTRRSLEETRRELSESLYQNDAAVRVIARVVLERDLARRKVMEGVKPGADTVATDDDHAATVGTVGGGKRRRVEDDTRAGVDVVPPADEDMEDVTNVDPQDASRTVTQEPTTDVTTDEAKDGAAANNGTPTVIPIEEAEQLQARWKQLSSQRKKTLKARKKKDKYRQQLHLKLKNDDATEHKPVTDQHQHEHKLDDSYATLESLRLWECTNTKNLHKASYKPGLLAMNGTAPTTTIDDDNTTTNTADNDNKDALIVTCARDKQLIFYDVHNQKVVHKEPIKTYVQSPCLDSFVNPTTNEKLIACVGEDGILRLYATAPTTTDDEARTNEWENILSCHTTVPQADAPTPNDQDEDKDKDEEGSTTAPNDSDGVVGVRIHPTGRHVFVVTSSGGIHFFAVVRDEGALTATLAAVFHDGGPVVGENGGKVACSCVGLHPDGLILAVGRGDGKVALWDLKTQKLASVLEGATDSKITALSFSENGYHVATSTIGGTVTIWDLRKQNIIATHSTPTTPTTNNETDDQTEPNTTEPKSNGVHSLAFCPTGKYIAYGTSHGEILLSPIGKTAPSDNTGEGPIVLRAEQTPGTPTRRKKKKGVVAASVGPGSVCGLVWGVDARSLASCNDVERGVRFWGIPEKDP